MQLPKFCHPTTTHHTISLDLSSIGSSIYVSPSAEWFHTLLSNLPSLRYLNVSNVNFLTHDSLIYISQQPPPPSVYTLHTFIAKGCHNLTAAGLEGFLRIGWPELQVLDLSGSTGAANDRALAAIADPVLLPSLKRFVLRNMELRDGAMEILAKGQGTNIKGLDIRRNLISNAGIKWLLDYCFSPPEYESGGMEGLPYPGPPNDGSDTLPGLTHLWISGNPRLSWASVGDLLRTTRLQILDCGSVAAEHPLLTLSTYAHKNLHTLRIDYRLIAPMSAEANPATTSDTAWRLKPTMLPNLRKLVLCGMPYYTPSSRIMEGLKQFLDDLADAEEGVERSTGVKTLRYLELLVLEMQALTVTQDEEDGGVGMYASSSSVPIRRDLNSVSSGEPGKEKQVGVLAELERFRGEGRKGRRKYWPGEIKVMRDIGWDDDGGVEMGSSGVDKWGVVEDRV